MISKPKRYRAVGIKDREVYTGYYFEMPIQDYTGEEGMTVEVSTEYYYIPNPDISTKSFLVYSANDNFSNRICITEIDPSTLEELN